MIRQEKEIKGIQIWKEELKLSLFEDDRVVNTENPMDSTKKLLDLIHEFVKMALHKLNIQQLKAFSCTKSEILETEIRKKIIFSKSTGKMKYLGTKLTKDIKDCTKKTT